MTRREEREMERLRGLLGKALDVLVLPGHAFSAAEWEDACVQSGRFCRPFVEVGKAQP